MGSGQSSSDLSKDDENEHLNPKIFPDPKSAAQHEINSHFQTINTKFNDLGNHCKFSAGNFYIYFNWPKIGVYSEPGSRSEVISIEFGKPETPSMNIYVLRYDERGVRPFILQFFYEFQHFKTFIQGINEAMRKDETSEIATGETDVEQSDKLYGVIYGGHRLKNIKDARKYTRSKDFMHILDNLRFHIGDEAETDVRGNIKYSGRMKICVWDECNLAVPGDLKCININKDLEQVST